MSKLALFYLLLSTDGAMLQSFNDASQLEKEAMMVNAGVENASEFVSLPSDELREILSAELIAETNSWKSLNRSAGNEDNKNNIGRIGIKRS